MKLKLLSALALLAAPLLVSLAAPARADVADRLYDFTDAFYLQNGVNPAAIAGRRQAVPPLAVQDTPIFAYQRDVRALLTFPSYDHSGKPWFFTVLGGLSAQGFTPDAAGRRARQIADRSIEYVFPARGADPLGLGGARQSVLLDMRHGYFSNNPLGLWLHVWVNYTPRAFSTRDGQKELSDLARKNGLALDGTPILRTTSEIDKLYKKGLVTKLVRPLNDPLRYAICPMIKDPRDGGIAPDQFLAITRKPDGTPVEPLFLREFESLQTTGDWAD
ncbi:MAG: hypothetical protein ACK47B_01010 [Armatimonadota bacterium]